MDASDARVSDVGQSQPTAVPTQDVQHSYPTARLVSTQEHSTECEACMTALEFDRRCQAHAQAQFALDGLVAKHFPRCEKHENLPSQSSRAYALRNELKLHFVPERQGQSRVQVSLRDQAIAIHDEIDQDRLLSSEELRCLCSKRDSRSTTMSAEDLYHSIEHAQATVSDCMRSIQKEIDRNGSMSVLDVTKVTDYLDNIATSADCIWNVMQKNDTGVMSTLPKH